jgi:cysteine sulfinate desulfinase/cysteine desulfurase-like protein
MRFHSIVMAFRLSPGCRNPRAGEVGSPRWRSPRTSSGTGRGWTLVVNGVTPPLFHGGGQGSTSLRDGCHCVDCLRRSALRNSINRSIEVPRVRELSQRLRAGIATVAPESVVVGGPLSVWQASTRLRSRLPRMRYDAARPAGVACSAGSACTAECHARATCCWRWACQ